MLFFLKVIGLSKMYKIGIYFDPFNLKNVLSFSLDEINQLVNHTFHPLTFSIRLIGLFPTVNFVLKAFKNRFQKKRLEANFKTILKGKK
jgi:hypothetical protein